MTSSMYTVNDFEKIFEDNTFDELNSEYLQEKFFRIKLGYIKPHSVKLGEINVQKKVKGKYRLITKDVLGFYVPFLEQLQQLLSMPEVQESLMTQRNSDIEFADIYDGSYYQNDFVLLFSIYYDDFELVNPIGSHKKKHKLSIVYWNLLNLNPEVRFKVQATQLLAVVQSRFLRKFGLSNLLQDFIQGLQQLQEGENFLIGTEIKKYHGMLYYVIGDTPAAQFLGGFKEGVGMAEKPCRTCEISHNDFNSRYGNQFVMRNEAEHHDRCDIINALRGETKAYWSKIYGITARSVLCDVPEFEITKCILHDPMHVLLEGVVKKEIQLMLSNFIDKKKYFTLAYVNSAIRNFNYTYEELRDRPQELERKSFDIKNTFPMTAIETKNFMVPLLFMISDKVPENDKIWENFLRLLKITLLVISPISSTHGIDTLKQLIATHNHNFRELLHQSYITWYISQCKFYYLDQLEIIGV